MSRVVAHTCCRRPHGSNTRQPSRVSGSPPPSGPGPVPAPRPPHRATATGQTLVEFALVLLVFMLVTVGLLDGLRVIFYYSQIQEAARQGARWGSVQVARAVTENPSQTPWGSFSSAYQGNAPGTYSDGCPSPPPAPPPVPPCYPLRSSRWADPTNPVTNTIVGAATLGMTAVNLSQATITISTTASTTTTETTQTDPVLFTNQPVTVTVQYPFRPILGMVFGGVTINLKGSSVMLHE